MRFRDPLVSASVIQACAVLQNYLMDIREDEENDDADFEDEEDVLEENGGIPERGDDEGSERFRKQLHFFKLFNHL